MGAGTAGLAVLEFHSVGSGFVLQRWPRSLGCWDGKVGEERGLYEMGKMYSPALPEGRQLAQVCSQTSGKGEDERHPLSSCSPLGCCLGSLSPCVRADQGTMAYHHRVSTSPVSAWEVVLKSPWFWPGHLPQRTSHCPFSNTFGMVPPPTPRCGSLHHLPR